jgi:hypothetical protein
MTVHTDLPGEDHYGEYCLARQLVGLNLPGVHLWFNVSWIPGVGEIDIIIWRERGGLFVCETKAVGLRQIESLTLDKIKLSRDERPHPTPQIGTLRKIHELRNQIKPKLSGPMPFVTPVLIWPNITAPEWRTRFGGEVAALASRMLFMEDVSSSAKVFDLSLVRVAQNPVIGPQGDLRPLDDKRLLVSFADAIAGRSAVPRARPSDIEKLRLLEAKVARQVYTDVPVDVSSRMLYRGGPGTGKTFRLLQLGVNHCIAGRSVLYACFNKTLAADIKRLFSLNLEIRSASQFPWVFDIADLLKYVSNLLGLQLGDIRFEDLEQWWLLVQAELQDPKNINIATFDLVLIDEIQDLEDWMLEFASAFLGPDGSIAVAQGIGQQLYTSKGDWLNNFESSSATVTLSRNFRNTAPVYEVASDMRRWATSFGDGDQLPESSKTTFDRPDGRAPSIGVLLDSTATTGGGLAFDRHMCEEYRRLIAREVESLYSSCESTDLLILVPQDVSNERRWAVDALQALGIPFIDYTRTRNNSAKWAPFLDERRLATDGETIRLCTYRSSRGLEGTRVLLFGLERSIQVAKALKVQLDSLLHVVLSRSLVECTVAIPSTVNTVERTALETAIQNAVVSRKQK